VHGLHTVRVAADDLHDIDAFRSGGLHVSRVELQDDIRPCVVGQHVPRPRTVGVLEHVGLTVETDAHAVGLEPFGDLRDLVDRPHERVARRNPAGAERRHDQLLVADDGVVVGGLLERVANERGKGHVVPLRAQAVVVKQLAPLRRRPVQEAGELHDLISHLLQLAQYASGIVRQLGANAIQLKADRRPGLRSSDQGVERPRRNRQRAARALEKIPSRNG
jgi:hypothetical protein